MWNRKHNSNDKVSAHTYTKNWRVVLLPIKVHPSDEYCNTGGLDCQYLRFKDVDRTRPYCAWNLEYRGKDYGDISSGEPSTKHPLRYDDKTKQVFKCHFCRTLGRAYYQSQETNTWENTLTIHDEEPV